MYNLFNLNTGKRNMKKSNRIGLLKYVVALSFMLILSACAAKHEVISSSTSTKLLPQKSIYISLSNDGRYGNINYPGSGINTSQVLLKNFSKYSNNITVSNQYRPFSGALSHAKVKGAEYLIYPTILEWEDRATEWSGKPDRISIKIQTVKVSTGKTLNSTIIQGKSAWATLGGDHPQDLLQKPIEELVNSLY